MLLLCLVFAVAAAQFSKCGSNLDCRHGLFCQFSVGTCPVKGDVVVPKWGTCAGRPGACPRLYSPVCGCDLKVCFRCF